MNGPSCPIHPDKPMDWLSTINQWEFYCKICDRRYNSKMTPKPEDNHE